MSSFVESGIPEGASGGKREAEFKTRQDCSANPSSTNK